MKIAPVLLGAVFAQESGDYSDYEAPATGGEDRWDSWGNDNNFLMASNEKAYSGTTQTVQAVTCWESNNMGDLRHYNTQNDDGFGWSNIHHGHDQAADSNIVTGDENDYQIGTVYVDHGNTNKIDHHSAEAFDNRYSGCIYEVDGWTYSSTTYNRKWQVTYGHDGTNPDNSGIDATTTFPAAIRVNWWHYFNAHVFAGGSVQTHYITMANPQYEGLGYLNFIATFAKVPTGDNFGSNAFYSSRASVNHNVEDTVTDNYSAGTSFRVFLGDSTELWYSTFGGTDAWTEQAALSSFPHNDLGKDFRFNVRVLHLGGDGDPTKTTSSNPAGKDSYYFYRINKIAINFPFVVRCPRENKHIASDSGSDTFRCMDSANLNGHRGWYNNQTNDHLTASKNENDPFYIETLSGGSFNAGFCTTAKSDGEWYQCGNAYTVKGLMNTYDERGQQEFGTHQEFWFQFFYHFEVADRTNGASGPPVIDSSVTSYTHYNYPNLLFNSFEVSSVAFECGTDNVYNSNACA